MTVRPLTEVWVVLYFTYLFVYSNSSVVLTPSFISTHGHSHTKGCFPLGFLAVSPDRLTHQQELESPFEMSTRIFLGGKGGRYVGVTTLPPSCAKCQETWEP